MYIFLCNFITTSIVLWLKCGDKLIYGKIKYCNDISIETGYVTYLNGLLHIRNDKVLLCWTVNQILYKNCTQLKLKTSTVHLIQSKSFNLTLQSVLFKVYLSV